MRRKHAPAKRGARQQWTALVDALGPPRQPSTWRPDPKRLQTYAGDRWPTISRHRLFPAWQRGWTIRLRRWWPQHTGGLPDHYTHERYCHGCQGTIVHPAPGGDLKRCMWCNDRHGTGKRAAPGIRADIRSGGRAVKYT